MDSVMNRGTTITLTIPVRTIVPVELPSPVPHAPYRRHGDPPSKAVKSRRVLLVDDHAVMLQT
jgi:hypothetical protein